MDEDGKMSISNGADFSSPNISSPNTDAAPTVNSAIQPQQAITSSDISAMANTDAGTVATAAAAMPENDTMGAISSGAITSQSITSQASRSRVGFAGRRFNAANTAATSTKLPDFFGQATAAQSDILLYGDNTNEKRGINVKLIALGALVGAIVLVVIIGLIAKGGAEIAERNGVKSAWNKFANQLLYGESKEDAPHIDDSSMAISMFLNNIYTAKSSADSYAKFSEYTKSIDEVITQNSSANVVQSDELDNIKDQLLLMRNIAEVGETPSAEKLAVCYATSGKESCGIQVEEHYSHAYDTHGEILQIISNLKLKQVSYEKQLADLYIQNNCVSNNGTLDKKCTSAVNSNYIVPTFAEEYAAAKNAADSSVQMRVKGFLSDIKKINSEINK